MILTTLTATLALSFSWLVAFFVLSGLALLAAGALTAKRNLLGFSLSDFPLRGAFWVGFALVFSLAQWVHLFMPINSIVVWFVILLGIVGWVLFGRTWLTSRALSFRPVILVAVVFLLGFTLYVANQSLLPALSTDAYLYHFQMIRMAEQYPQIPGIANVHYRFGHGIGLGPGVALFDFGPWNELGHHLFSSLLLVGLGFEAVARLRARGFARTPLIASAWLALLFVSLVGLGPFYFRGMLVGESGSSYWLTSPNPDFVSLVLIVVSGLYLMESFLARDARLSRAAGFISVVAVTPAAFIRPLNLFWFALVAVLVFLRYLYLLSSRTKTAVLRLVGLSLSIASLILVIPLVATHLIVSGYFLYPLSIFSSSAIQWRVPLEVTDSYRQVVQQWARDPDGASNWFPIWAIRTSMDVWSQAALILLVLSALALILGALSSSRFRRGVIEYRATAVVLLPVTLTMVAWFILGPDLRFAYGLIWLVPITLITWLVSALAFVRSTRWALAATYLSVSLVVFYVLTAEPGGLSNLRLRVADGDGSFGLPKVAVTPVMERTNINRVRVNVPNEGENCGAAEPPCGLGLSDQLAYRGFGVREGFVILN